MSGFLLVRTCPMLRPCLSSKNTSKVSFSASPAGQSHKRMLRYAAMKRDLGQMRPIGSKSKIVKKAMKFPSSPKLGMTLKNSKKLPSARATLLGGGRIAKSRGEVHSVTCEFVVAKTLGMSSGGSCCPPNHSVMGSSLANFPPSWSVLRCKLVHLVQYAPN